MRGVDFSIKNREILTWVKPGQPASLITGRLIVCVEFNNPLYYHMMIVRTQKIEP